MPEYEPVESPDATTLFPYHDLTPPTTADVYRAWQIVREHLPRTPLVRSEWLSAELDAEVFLKREDVLPTGAFKVRGGLTLASSLDEEFRDQGLITASTGNHGQSIAYAGRAFGISVTIGVPEDPNPSKVAAMERLGARVIEHGADFDEAREHVEERAAETGDRYVHSANEPGLIAGVGTAGLEVLDDCPEVDVLVCPVGGGSGASGYCLTAGAIAGASVIGVQSSAAPAAYRAYTEGHLDPHDEMGTFAEGMATRVPFALSQRILRERLAEMWLVDDDALRDAMRRAIEEEHLLVEGAAAAPIAALLERANAFAGQTVVLPISGRNVAMDTLQEGLAPSDLSL